LTEEKANVPANPQAVPAMVDAPFVLSQAPPIPPTQAKPVVDKPTTITAPTVVEQK
jgi:hypothetical protein